MGAGKVDYDNLWRDVQQRSKRIRWRKLKFRLQWAAPATLIFGYAVHEQTGPWFGFTAVMLKDVPCVHCGQKPFGNAVWNHICGGVKDGKCFECGGDHPCKGEPSMDTAPLWRSCDWVEVDP